MDSNRNLRKVKIPVLEVYGEGGDGKDKIEADVRSDTVLARYKQVFIPKADHQFDVGEEEMVKAVVDWPRKKGE